MLSFYSVKAYIFLTANQPTLCSAHWNQVEPTTASVQQTSKYLKAGFDVPVPPAFPRCSPTCPSRRCSAQNNTYQMWPEGGSTPCPSTPRACQFVSLVLSSGRCHQAGHSLSWKDSSLPHHSGIGSPSCPSVGRPLPLLLSCPLPHFWAPASPCSLGLPASGLGVTCTTKHCSVSPKSHFPPFSVPTNQKGSTECPSLVGSQAGTELHVHTPALQQVM